MRERILKAFIEEAQKKSIKFTMDDLAQNLGISKRTIYEHFTSKKEILETIIEKSFNEIKEKEEAIINRKDIPTVDKIKEILTIVPDYFDLYNQQILDQMKKYYPEQWEKVRFELKNTWNNLRLLLEQGIQEGVIKNYSIPIIMKIISSSTNWFYDQNYLLNNRININDAFTTTAEILMFGLVNEKK
ncbi:TetR/AcrR family transcriptional regulator [Aeribacillus composti]|uniref:TetR/AcrR family transcriptional regulator n=1 Tax=Aeribacillus composti TaxID=1868734 RepID=UPI002E2458B3|nr:TetR/AcrR family transcriptional regulator [Aeribacillus composti]